MPNHEQYLENIGYYRNYGESLGCKESNKRFYINHTEELKDKSLTYYYKNRTSVLQKYHDRKVLVMTKYGNGKCACVRCGEDDVDCLTIDHINNDGAQKRRERLLLGSRSYL